ncbi:MULTISPECIES: type II secretion system F family protein [unclassified Streptomyces]|uniref:type II secretion system F family protein n=1 Tax=unclassified Streptomyces TaxID=2593676 RepID=UPI002473ADA2|nr:MULTISPECIES: type II secretion system F family protein [unclassified Streptomyces]MDH6451864.1 Flp pilus assembly protein TadB [Streptomyces sp. SAI-119]MDH6497581.1 Flp pilus assembly protein TadB [Streptomyces sp. SAI-149]
MSAEVVHRLGVVLGTALAVAWFARWAAQVRRERRLRRRLGALLAAAEAGVEGPRFEGREFARRWLPVLGVGCSGWVLVGGVAGVVVGLVVAAGLWRWRWRLRQSAGAGAGAGEVDAREAARQLPLAADLLAACIAAGAGPVIAAQAVGEALGGPVGEGLARGAAEVRLGGAPDEAWRKLASTPGAGALARLLERADVTGVPAAGPVAGLAADARADWGRAATARARKAAVLVTAPVGLCFLPAFIAVGVLPIVIGLAGGVLGGGGR